LADVKWRKEKSLHVIKYLRDPGLLNTTEAQNLAWS